MMNSNSLSNSVTQGASCDTFSSSYTVISMSSKVVMRNVPRVHALKAFFWLKNAVMFFVDGLCYSVIFIPGITIDIVNVNF